MRRAVLILVATAVLTFFAGLGRGAMTDADEAYYAESAREMIERGDWLTPHFNYRVRFEKPVLYYWLVAAGYQVVGVGPGAARWPSALSGLGLVLVTFWWGRRWIGHDAGLLAGLIVATSFGYFAVARMALPDLPLTFFTCLGLFAAVEAIGRPTGLEPGARARRGWLLLAAASLGCGFLVKGPVALALAGLVLAVLAIVERGADRSLWRRLFRVGVADAALALLVLAAIAVPWYAVMGWVHGSEYLHRFFVGENVDRFATARYNDPRSLFFYVPVLLGGLFPWSPMLALAVPAVAAALRRARPVGLIEWRLVTLALVPFLFYSVSIGKQPRYILPVLPPLALLVASGLAAWQSSTARATRGCVRAAAVTSGAALAVLGFLTYRTGAVLASTAGATEAALPSAAGAGLVMLAAGGLLVVAAARARLRQVPWLVAGATVAVQLTLAFTVLSTGSPEPVETMASHVRQARAGNEPVGTYRAFVRNLVFYSGVPTVDLITEDQLVSFLASDHRVLCVLPTDAIASLPEELPRPRILAEVRYFNPAALRLGTLLAPRAERDLETVALVSNR